MKYNALQAVFQKRYAAQGLEYQVAYTYSKCMTDNSGLLRHMGQHAGSPCQPVLTRTSTIHALTMLPAILTQSTFLVLNACMRFPFGRGKKWGANASGAVNQIAGGWFNQPNYLRPYWFPPAPVRFRYGPNNVNSRGQRPNCGAGVRKVFGRQAAFDPSSGKYIGYKMV